MRFYNRNGVLYYSINGKRKSTKLEYSKQNIKKFKSYYKDDEFFNKFNINKKISKVVELCSLVLEEKEKEVKRNSYNSYLSVYYSRILPYFKDKLVTEIEPLNVYYFYKTFTDKSTLNTCDVILKKAFQKAIILKEIKTTPFIIDRPKFKSTYKINPFTFDEANTIILNAPILIKNFIAIGFYSGMRTGELMALRWDKIDFNNYTIEIDTQFTNGFEDTPKTSSSIRTIDMLPICERYLKEQYKITSYQEYVFLNSKNKPFKATAIFRYFWIDLLKSLDIEYRSIYQLRHSFASNMLSNNESIHWVSQMLGHKNSFITLNVYSKYIKKVGERKYTYLDK